MKLAALERLTAADMVAFYAKTVHAGGGVAPVRRRVQVQVYGSKAVLPAGERAREGLGEGEVLVDMAPESRKRFQDQMSWYDLPVAPM